MEYKQKSSNVYIESASYFIGAFDSDISNRGDEYENVFERVVTLTHAYLHNFPSKYVDCQMQCIERIVITFILKLFSFN